MPLNKTQIQYLTQKLQSAKFKAQSDFAKNHPCKWSNEEVLMDLRNSGFEVKDGYNISNWISRPKTKAMLDNQAKYDAFFAASNEAYNDAVDVLNLGGTEEALALLRDFTTRLEQLARV